MITLRHYGKSAEDLRFFIALDGEHAGGISVHSVQGSAFSYGIAISPYMRGRNIASQALLLLFEDMRRRGFSLARVQIYADNAASIALHRRLGFVYVCEDDGVIYMEKEI